MLIVGTSLNKCMILNIKTTERFHNSATLVYMYSFGDWLWVLENAIQM